MKKKEVVGLVVLFILATALSYGQTCGNEICEDKDCYADCSDALPRPSNIFGQIVDEEGTPVYDEVVSARWIDAYGNNQSATAKTMSKEQAEKFGNKKLEGFFLFTDGTIRADPNTMIEVRSQPRYTFLLVNPQEGRTRDIGSIRVFGVIPDKQGPVELGENISLKEIFSLLLAWIWNHLLYVIIVLILSIGVYIFRREYQRRKRIKSVTDLAVYRAMRDFMPSHVEEIMQKNLVAVQEHENSREAIKKILQTHHGSILVMHGESAIGLLSEQHLIKVFNALDENSNAAQCMEPLRVSTSPNTPLLEALRLMVQNKTRKLPVVKDKTTIGLISMTDITKAITEHFQEKVTDNRLPLVSGLYKTILVRVEKDALLQEVISSMIHSISEYCLVYEYADPSKRVIRTLGIITAKDVLKELYKGSDGQKVKAQHIMSSPIISMGSRFNALEAIRIMREKNVRILPILESEKIVGVITEEIVMAALYHYISQTSKKIEDFKRLIK